MTQKRLAFIAFPQFRLLVFLFLIANHLVSAQNPSPKKDEINRFALEPWQAQLAEPVIRLMPGRHFYLARIKEGLGGFEGTAWQVARELPGGFFILDVQAEEASAKDLSERFLLVIPANDNWKLAPGLQDKLERGERAEQRFLVQVTDAGAFVDFLQGQRLADRLLAEYPEQQSFLLRLTSASFKKHILPSPLVRFADIRPAVPTLELALQQSDLSVNKVNLLHARHPKLNGKGLTVSVKEYRPDSTDIDIRDRYISSGIGALGVATHSTIMATIIGGGGNSFYTGKGVAWGVNLSSASFFNLFPESDAYYRSVQVQNHSYGLGMENYYGAEARAYDDQAYRNPSFVHVFSAGNIGDSTSREGPYAGIANLANLSGNFKMGKNLLTVGAVDSFYQVELRSSRGPAYDGRVKPELVAFGQDGSSGAAAITSGVAILIQQAYKELHRDSLPAASMVRAVLLNSADDLGPEGPDYVSGFGNVNAARAVELVKKERLVKGALGSGESAVFQIDVPAGATNLKITLAWTDPPAGLNAARALVNDLDLELNGAGNTWLPWVLNHFPHRDSLAQLARRRVDRLNNQEQITLQQPAPGRYAITVKGFNVGSGKQEFSLVYDWEMTNSFRWTFPCAPDNARAGGEVPVRWESNIQSGPASLHYNLLGSQDWFPIDNSTDLVEGFQFWSVPDTTALARLRMTTDAGVFFSDTFTISAPLRPTLVLDCPDSLLWTWPSVRGVKSYQLYSFRSDTLTPFRQVADTAVVLQKSAGLSSYFAVAPVIQPAYIGVRSPTFRTDFQAGGCYIRKFFATRSSDQIGLSLELGTVYGVKSAFFEKKAGGVFTALGPSLSPGLSLTYNDRELIDGYNTYRAGVNLLNGKTIYSEEAAILFASPGQYLVFPNPVQQGGEVIVVSNVPKSGSFRLFDSMGRLVFRDNLLDEAHSISTGHLQAGVYFYMILKDGGMVKSGKIVVN